jgi:hypothetical protein
MFDLDASFEKSAQGPTLGIPRTSVTDPDPSGYIIFRIRILYFYHGNGSGIGSYFLDWNI